MDKIILGLLMLRRFTVYEIRNIIKLNFKSMCSDSLGSIQAAVKKLLEAQMLTCNEYVEKGVNKKQYSITARGRRAFMDWIKTPADLTNAKNMELGKLLFMGLLPAKTRRPLVDEMVVLLEKELAFLLTIQSSANEPAGKKQAVDYWKNNPEYFAGIKNATLNSDMSENVNAIVYFELITLQYGIDYLKFNIKWLRALSIKMRKLNFARTGKKGGKHR